MDADEWARENYRRELIDAGEHPVDARELAEIGRLRDRNAVRRQWERITGERLAWG